ncbi:MAG TPA: DUF5995 family protein [Candidatus Angelobacter sp.]|jgi:hypothetical protein|nr:DUF5995 family protein [Candidatus Angelobacter sp.]
MSATPAPSGLLTIVTSTPPVNIDGVVQIMQGIDAALADNDGLKWFNLLYLEVTQQVQQHPPVGGWKAPIWLSRLDVIFATLYFKAIADSLSGNPIPSSWQALFEARQRTGIDRIQFALAGMNAHINHDLALALLAIDTEMHQGFSSATPEHQDYEHVNDLLQAVLPQALTLLATGVLGQIAEDTGKIGKLLAIWDVRVARDLAWDFAAHVQSIPKPFQSFALATQDQLTGTLGRSLLVPIQ